MYIKKMINYSALGAIAIIYIVLLVLAYYYKDQLGHRIVDILSAVLIWRGTWGLIDYSETELGLTYGFMSNIGFLVAGIMLVCFDDPLLSNV